MAPLQTHTRKRDNKIGADGLTKQQRWLQRNRDKVNEANRLRNRKKRQERQNNNGAGLKSTQTSNTTHDVGFDIAEAMLSFQHGTQHRSRAHDDPYPFYPFYPLEKERVEQISDNVAKWSKKWGGLCSWYQNLLKAHSQAAHKGTLIQFGKEITLHHTSGQEIMDRLSEFVEYLPNDPDARKLLWKLQTSWMKKLVQGITILETMVEFEAIEPVTDSEDSEEEDDSESDKNSDVSKDTYI